MALKVNKNIKGITQGWYVKIFNSKGINKGNTTQTYGYFTNATEAQNHENAVEINSFNFTAVVNTDIFAQGYAHLKALPDFENSVDC